MAEPRHEHSTEPTQQRELLPEAWRSIEQSLQMPEGLTGRDVISATLCTLAQRVSEGQMDRVREALPEPLREIAGTCPLEHHEVARVRGSDALAGLADHLGTSRGYAEQAARILFAALRAMLPRNRVERVAAELPQELEVLWRAPEPSIRGEPAVAADWTRPSETPAESQAPASTPERAQPSRSAPPEARDHPTPGAEPVAEPRAVEPAPLDTPYSPAPSEPVAAPPPGTLSQAHRAAVEAMVRASAPRLDLPAGIQASDAVTIVTCVLAQRLRPGEGTALIQELPEAMRPVLAPCAIQREEALRTADRARFVGRVAEHLGITQEESAQVCTQAFAVLRHHLSPATAGRVFDRLSLELRALWSGAT